jgi:hypothetical protein
MAAKKCDQDRMSLQRLAARTFVVLGGLFWVMAAFSAERVYNGGTDLVSASNALLPLALTIAVFAIGWYQEYLVAAILGITSFGVVVWGATVGWEPGVWMLMLATLVAPMVISGTLYLMAARMGTVCKLEHEASGEVTPAGAPVR